MALVVCAEGEHLFWQHAWGTWVWRVAQVGGCDLHVGLSGVLWRRAAGSWVANVVGGVARSEARCFRRWGLKVRCLVARLGLRIWNLVLYFGGKAAEG